jgi:imidazolonepropionase-like amidohydrolase
MTGASGNGCASLPVKRERLMTGTTERHRETFQRALKLPVKIAFGTDLNGNHERGAQEFVWMVRYGIAPIKALLSATSVAAEFMGWQDRIGTLEAGKLADVVAVKGNPLDDMDEIMRLMFVMKDGVIYKNE